MSAAMALIRGELGPEALILSTRRVAGGVEVTAALEPGDADEGRQAALGATNPALYPAVQPAVASNRVRDLENPHVSDFEILDDSGEVGSHNAAPASHSPASVAYARSVGDVRAPSVRAARNSATLSKRTALTSSLPLPDPLMREDSEASHFPVARVDPGAGITAGTPASEHLMLGQGRVDARPLTTAARFRNEARAAPYQPRRLPERVAETGSASIEARDDRATALRWHGVPPAIAARLAAGPLAFALSVALPFVRLDLSADAPPLLVAGPPGAGKTLTVARLATRLVLAGRKPLVVTADGRRAGATEQLAAFTRLLGLHLLVASTPAALARALARRIEGAPVLIDGPGTDPFVPAHLVELSALAVQAGAITALVCPAGLDANEAADIGAVHRAYGATVMVANRLDVGRRLGGVLAAAHAGLALAEAGIGPGVADGLVAMTPDLLAKRLLTVPGQS